MNVRDLLIFTFPGTNKDVEVIQGGQALFDKYVRKHTDPHAEGKKLLDGKDQSSAKDGKQEISTSGRVWLMNVDHLKEPPTIETLRATHVFDPKSLRQPSGIYLIFHAQFGVPSLFGASNDTVTQGPGSASENWEAGQRIQAAKLVGVFKSLGMTDVQKICLVACKTVVTSPPQKKSFLESFVIELHENGFHPKVAGWDIPIEIVTKEGETYGRKQVQGDPKSLLKGERKAHKLVYVYTSAEHSFNIKSSVASDEAKFKEKLAEEDIAVAKKLAKGSTSIMESTLKKTTTQSEEKSKITVAWKMDFVARTRYGASGWSG